MCPQSTSSSSCDRHVAAESCAIWCVQDVHSRNIVVRVYYRYRVFMGICCICCEVLYLALYLQHWEPRQPALSCAPSCLSHLLAGDHSCIASIVLSMPSYLLCSLGLA